MVVTIPRVAVVKLRLKEKVVRHGQRLHVRFKSIMLYSSIALGVLGAAEGRQETEHADDDEGVPVLRSKKKLTLKGFGTAIISNRPLLVLILMTVSPSPRTTSRRRSSISRTTFSANVTLLPFVNFISIGSSIIGILSIPTLTRLIGKNRTALLGFVIAATADGLNFLLPTNTVLFTYLVECVLHRRRAAERRHLGTRLRRHRLRPLAYGGAA